LSVAVRGSDDGVLDCWFGRRLPHRTMGSRLWASQTKCVLHVGFGVEDRAVSSHPLERARLAFMT
jgi:hypothetical protein